MKPPKMESKVHCCVGRETRLLIFFSVSHQGHTFTHAGLSQLLSWVEATRQQWCVLLLENCRRTRMWS